MKKKIFWSMLLLACFSMAYAQKTDKEKADALKFNEYMVEVIDTVYQYGVEWGNKAVEYKETKTFHKLSFINRKLFEYLERKQLEVLRYKNASDLDKLKIALIDFLTIEKLIVQSSMVRFEYLDSQSSFEEINNEFENLKGIAQFEEEYMGKLKALQEETAKAYGYVIAPKRSN
ncbi:hypothetical protein ACFRAE_12840 [Sphingobacterium sp. HJSM2_6]|uniref:hypothetical protein n=1 Tax=Sphingobacterium sp. HJSM2_6 TaxID=3366264 RepID=UPI003BD93B74